MQPQKIKGLEGWVNFLSQVEIPVLRQTERDLNKLLEDIENISARDVADVIAHDPMMTVQLLRYLQSHKSRKQEHEVVQVEQALLMLGVEAFLSKSSAQPLVEEVLHSHTGALICILQVVRRSHRASYFAHDWAIRMRDMHFEEVCIAALLCDLAELLMWCFAPDSMLEIKAMQQQDKTLRSRVVQEQVLGFSLLDLQLALARAWSLPKLLLALIDEEQAMQPRTRSVVLAVNLARHSAKGWDDMALPDDYQDIGLLLNMSPQDVMVMVGARPVGISDKETF